MERQRYRELKTLLRQAACGHRNNPRCVHRDATIVAVLLWAVLHNKPVSWATQAANWSAGVRPRVLPSQSCMSRRLRHVGVLRLIQRLEQLLRQRLPHGDIKLIDARPLPVGGCSKDPDAHTGYGAGHCLQGYKLHLLCDLSGAVDHWLVTAMNHAEPAAAERILDQNPEAAYVISDGNYDVNRLYERAAERQIQWLALPRRRAARAPGHRRHSSGRLRLWGWVHSPVGRRLLRRLRSGIERVNAWQGCAANGLHYLPHHVRRAARVRVWVALKLIIYHHWLAQRIDARRTA